MNIDVKPNKIVSETNPVVYLNMIMSTVLQYSSDTAYPLLVSDSTVLRAQSPTRLPSLEMAVTSLEVPRLLTLLTNWLQIQEDSRDRPPHLTIHLYDSQNLRKWYTYFLK